MKKNSRKNRGGGPDGVDRITVVPVHGFTAIATTSNTATLDLNPTLMGSGAGRLASIAPQFQNYRIRSLRFRPVIPTVVAAAGTAQQVVCGYLPGQSLPPSGIADFENHATVVYNSNYTCPSEWARCSRRELQGQFPWYKSDPSASIEANSEEVGSIRIYTSVATVNFHLEYIAVYEFKDPVDTLLTMGRGKLIEKEKERLKKILGVPEGSDFLMVPASKTLETSPFSPSSSRK